MKKNKPYAKKVYNKKNIIGYTGDINNNPTVYFKKKQGNTIQVGHITQDHGNKSNIGRETVLSGKKYTITNNNGQAVESINNSPYHMSRSKFIPVKKSDKKTMNELARSIKKFPKMKTIHNKTLQKITEMVEKGNLKDLEKQSVHVKAMGKYVKDKLAKKKTSTFLSFTCCLNSKSTKSATLHSPRTSEKKPTRVLQGMGR